VDGRSKSIGNRQADKTIRVVRGEDPCRPPLEPAVYPGHESWLAGRGAGLSNRVRWTSGARLATPRRTSATCRVDCRGRAGAKGSRVRTIWADIRDRRGAIAVAIAPREAEWVPSGHGKGQRGVYIPLHSGIRPNHRPTIRPSHSASPLSTRPCRAGVLASPGSRTVRNQGCMKTRCRRQAEYDARLIELGRLARCHGTGKPARARYSGKAGLPRPPAAAGGRYSGWRPLGRIGRGKLAGRYSGPGDRMVVARVLPATRGFKPSARFGAKRACKYRCYTQPWPQKPADHAPLGSRSWGLQLRNPL